jgi:hypothetical protein
MNKLEVQKRVTGKNGLPLPLESFEWDEKTRVFSSNEMNLVLSFEGEIDITFKTSHCCQFITDSHCHFSTGSCCDFKTGSNCNFKTESSCNFQTGPKCNFQTGSCCDFKTGYCCNFNTLHCCNFNTGHSCSFNTKHSCCFDTGNVCNFLTLSDCNFKTGQYCFFKTGHSCSFDTEYCCNFKTGQCCNFNTGPGCTFTTEYGCNFNTASGCTFDVRERCTFKVDEECVIVCRGGAKTITLQTDAGDNIQFFNLTPTELAYIKNGLYNGKPHILADGIVSEVINQKGNVYHVINIGETEKSYLIKNGDKYAHGKTLKEARDALIYKLSDRDTSKYEDFTLDTKMTKNEAIQMYMTVTGACSLGTKYFVDNHKTKKRVFTVKDIIELTKGQYEHETLVEFFEGKR